MALIKKINRHIRKRARMLCGSIDGLCSGVVFGWALRRGDPQAPVRLEVMVDGVRIGEVETTIPRPDVAQAGPRGRCGFAFDLGGLGERFDGGSLNLRDSASGELLAAEPLRLDLDDAFGIIDGLEGEVIRGWAVPVAPGAISVPLEVLLDGEVAGEVLPDLPRPDLQALGMPVQHSGFRFAAPAKWLDGKPHAVTVRVRGSGKQLMSGAPLMLQVQRSRIHANIEGVCRGVLFGWAADPERPRQTLALEILLDGEVIGNVTTGIVRPDLSASAPWQSDSGFIFDMRSKLHRLHGQRVTLRELGCGQSLSNEPVVLESGAAFGMLDTVAGVEISGWAVPAALQGKPMRVEILLDGELAGAVVADLPRPDLRAIGVPMLRTGFRFTVPAHWLDGDDHEVTARFGTGQLLQTPRRMVLRSKICAAVDTFRRDAVSGWIANLEGPQQIVRFDLWVNGRLIKESVAPEFRRMDVEMALWGGEERDCYLGFHVELPSDIGWRHDDNDVDLRLPGASTSLLAGTASAVDRAHAIDQIEQMGAQLLALTKSADTFGQTVRTQLAPAIARALVELRGRPMCEPLLVRPPAALSRPVDVIVPVYKGYDETLECLHSVIRAQQRGGVPMELVVINDHSPDNALTTELRCLESKLGFTLLENKKNLGFVATVNRGMRLHPDRDVVLLNSDTLVPSGWLDGLRRAAYVDHHTGTVTPLSNRATIFSLPRTCEDNDMPLGLSVQELHALCAERNAGVRVDVPTAMGFCMYIRREALEQVGLFDEERWAKGYAEENDFSIRAAGLGWRHVAACDVFVQHHGSVSFEGDKAPRVAENLAKLNGLYPDYPVRVQRFIEQDPIAIARGRIHMPLLARLAPRWILFVTHGLGGGTEKALRDLAERHAMQDLAVLVLRSTPAGRIELAPLVREQEKSLTASYPKDTAVELLAEQLRELGIESVHFHHALGLPAAIWDLPAMLDVPYDVTVHDFYLACPRITMIDESGQYCGQPDGAACERCVATGKLEHGVADRLEEIGGTVAAWREFHTERLSRARSVVAPSRDTVTRLNRYIPVRVEALPHAEEPYANVPAVSQSGTPHTVAVIGAIGPHKGAELLLSTARHALRLGLPLRFVVVGYTNCDDAFIGLPNVEITGRYTKQDLPALLAISGATAALFLSVWPETYSYTLSEAWRAGLTPVALDIGAPAERIRDIGKGKLIPFPATPQSVAAALLEVFASKSECANAAMLARKSSSSHEHTLIDA